MLDRNGMCSIDDSFSSELSLFYQLAMTHVTCTGGMQWFCEMNTDDEYYNDCSVEQEPEEDDPGGTSNLRVARRRQQNMLVSLLALTFPFSISHVGLINEN